MVVLLGGENMKVSKYNHVYKFYDNVDQKVIYNARTGSLALMNREYIDAYDSILKSQNIANEKVAEQFLMGGFAVEDDIDEIDLIRMKTLTSRYSTNSLSLTIAPTMECNFDCVYCYEHISEKAKRMSQETQDSIIKMIESKVGSIESLHITWYGGEPTLAVDTVVQLSERMIKICDDNNIHYNAFIVSNGYALNESVAEQLVDVRVGGVQYSIDGPPETHDKRRPLKGGQPTFEKIIENIRGTKNIFNGISVRVNVDNENQEQISSLLDIFKSNDIAVDDNVMIYVANVDSHNECYSRSLCSSGENFADFELDFHKSKKDRGFKGTYRDKYPKIKANFCSADSLNGLVIDPEGYIYKCWSDIGIKERVTGNVNSSKANEKYNRTLLVDYMMYDSTTDSECRDCSVLPLCVGGCPRKRMENDSTKCTEYRYQLDEYVINTAKEIYDSK